MLVFVFDLVLRTMIKVEISGIENPWEHFLPESRSAECELHTLNSDS